MKNPLLPLRLAQATLLLSALLLTGCPGSNEPAPDAQNPDDQKPSNQIPAWGKQPSLPSGARPLLPCRVRMGTST